MKPLEFCILAAGMGTRMKSDKPKVLHPIAGRPMLEHLLGTARQLKPTRLHLVIGSKAEQIREAITGADLNFVLQAEQRGTGHAVMQALPHFAPDARVVILLGDAPLIELDTIQRMLAAECDLGILTVLQQNPFNYGRIIRDGEQIKAIVEEKDATDEQRQIGEVNTGVMIADAAHLFDWLSKIDDNNAQGELLLTDIVAVANAQGSVVRAIVAGDPVEVQGVNNFVQLSELESDYQQRLARHWMMQGVHIIDSRRINFRGKVTIGRDTQIDINCVLEGEVKLGNRVKIGANCTIKDSVIGDGVNIKPNTIIDGASVESNCSIGPFARLRPGSELGEQCAIGNFVEVKKTRLGTGTKASHLSYLGDAVIGTGVNIGAGTITCNYDGVNKHVTEIGDGVFVGSNTALVAPVSLGENVTIAAGSTITKSVPDSNLGIARGKQKNVAGWANKGKK